MVTVEQESKDLLTSLTEKDLNGTATIAESALLALPENRQTWINILEQKAAQMQEFLDERYKEYKARRAEFQSSPAISLRDFEEYKTNFKHYQGIFFHKKRVIDDKIRMIRQLLNEEREGENQTHDLEILYSHPDSQVVESAIERIEKRMQQQLDAEKARIAYAKNWMFAYSHGMRKGVEYFYSIAKDGYTPAEAYAMLLDFLEDEIYPWIDTSSYTHSIPTFFKENYVPEIYIEPDQEKSNN